MKSPLQSTADDAIPAAWLPIALAGLCATLIGLGIGRFAYVPLLPLLIDAHWTTVSGAAQIAAANLVGYLIGSASAHRIALWRGAGPAIRGAMLAVLLSLVACSVNFGVLWLWAWRMTAGVAGGMLMILAAPFLMRQIAPASRGKAIGVVFSGIGMGIVFSGLAVPAVGGANLGAAWLILAGFMLPALIFAWPKFDSPPVVDTAPAVPQPLWPRGALLALLCAYVLDAIGYLPHTVFWVEYLVHDLGKPLAVGGAFWAVFGAGAAVGPLLSGAAADRFGFRKTLVACFVCKALAVTLPLWSTSMPALFVSSFAVGALTPGMVAVASGRAVELGGVAAHQRNWAMMTFLYALVQAVAGYAMAAVYSATHSFTLLFSVAGAVLLLAAIIAGVQRPSFARRSPHS
ncbi:MAG: YbfB/YjiJ family MFS transporter [Herminiimonas sp.]|nr:YbfB/YjiJ family MFS transporter [Herminiimonas sp.]